MLHWQSGIPSVPALRPVFRSRGSTLAAPVQAATGDAVELACVDQVHTGEHAAAEAQVYHMRLKVVKLPKATKGFVLPQKR